MMLQGIVLPQVLQLKRIITTTNQVSVQPNRATSHTHLIMQGEEYDISGLADRPTVDKLEGANERDWILWLEDQDRGNFHVLMELNDNLSVGEKLDTYSLHLLRLVNICDTSIVDPKVAA